jgi:hypothetical protein
MYVWVNIATVSMCVAFQNKNISYKNKRNVFLMHMKIIKPTNIILHNIRIANFVLFSFKIFILDNINNID